MTTAAWLTTVAVVLVAGVAVGAATAYAGYRRMMARATRPRFEDRPW
jgi:hypothetical protein